MDPGTSSLKWNVVVFNDTNNTCAFTANTSHNFCCKKGLYGIIMAELKYINNHRNNTVISPVNFLWNCFVIAKYVCLRQFNVICKTFNVFFIPSNLLRRDFTYNTHCHGVSVQNFKKRTYSLAFSDNISIKTQGMLKNINYAHSLLLWFIFFFTQ